MRFASIVFFTATALVSSLPALAAGGRTLDECFQASLRRAETVAVSDEQIKQAEEVYNQALGSMLPTVQGVASYTRIDKPNGFSGPADQPLAKLTASQPLFVGFRDFSALRQNKSLVAATKLNRDAAVLQLYKDVASAFFNVLSVEMDLRNVMDEIGALQQRITELQKFKRIGRSRLSEVLTAQQQQSSLKATAKQLEGQRSANREVLAVLTGFDTQAPLTDAGGSSSTDVGTLASGLARIGDRPEVVSAEAQVAAANESIDLARGGHLPTVGLNGDYFLYRTGPDKDSKWDVQLALTVPIYNGGIVTSQVRQAVSRKRQGEDSKEQARRVAEQEIRTTFDALQSDKEQLQQLDETTRIAKKNYDEETREYRLGLVTNLDVLTALQAFEESKRALDREHWSIRLDREHYLAAVAQAPAGFALSSSPRPYNKDSMIP